MAEIFYFLGHEQFHPEVLVKHAQLAEKAGFDGVLVSEHFNPWVADVGASGYAFSTLGAIAAVTKKIKMMTGVVTPLFRYHPAVIAQAAATLDRLSHGRFILGVGTGESINESPLGYQYPGYKERSARMIEALKIMRSLLHGEKISFKGEFYQTENAKLYSPPLVGVPIYMAAGGPKSAVLAGEFADGLILSVKNPQETVETLIKPAQQKSAEIGNKKFAIEASRWTVFAQNQDEAWEALQAWRGLRAPERDKATDPQQLQDAADAMPREEILSKYTVLSSPQDYVNAYSALITDCHANIVTIQTTSVDQEKLIEMLGKEVVPTLKAL